jgi:two-component system, NtrC family, nitrogen regulation sensor histidine kinase NtrY
MNPRLRFDQHALGLALVAALPSMATTLALLWAGDYSPKVRWTVALLLVATSASALAALRQHIVTPLQTLANLVAALREDDFSIRGRSSAAGDPLGDVMTEVNALAETLHEQRLGAVEATALLRTVMEQIDVATSSSATVHRTFGE